MEPNEATPLVNYKGMTDDQLDGYRSSKRPRSRLKDIHKQSRMATDVDDVLKCIKPFGRYQILMTVVCSYMFMLTQINNFFMGYGGIMPRWSCADSNFHNVTMPTDDCGVYQKCSKENLSFTSDFYSVVQHWSLVCDQAYSIELITSVQMIGLMVGGFIIGPITDLYGRKWTFLVVYTCGLVLGAVSGASNTVTVFIVFRFLIGVSVGAQYLVGCVFAGESTTNRYRLLMQTIAMVFPSLSNQVFIAYVTKHWVLYSIAGNLEGVFLLPLVAIFTHESPRWLVQKGRVEEATQILHKIAHFNGMSDKVPEMELETESKKGHVKSYHMWDLFRTRRLATYTLVSVLTWFGISLAQYGMFFDIGYLPTNVYVNGAMLAGVAMLLIPMAAYEAYNKNMNRKYVQVALILFTGLCNVAVALFQTVIPESTVSGVFLSVFSIVGQVATDASFGVLYVYSIELFPTLLRSNAGALNSVGARIGGIIAPQLLYARKSWKPLPYVVFAAVCGLGALLDAFFLPNTKNMHLPETYKQCAEEQSDEKLVTEKN